jgi:ATP/maltotriose-dependent transcriptional regulator MalT
MSSPEESSTDMLAQLRLLSHRLSNALEVIMQAQYLLQRSQEPFDGLPKKAVPKAAVAKKEESPKKQNSDRSEDQKWTTMIGNAAAEAAETNREIRDTVRRLSALQAAEPKPSLTLPRSR